MNWTVIAVAFAGCGAYVYAMSRLGKWIGRQAASQSGPLPSLAPFRQSLAPRDARPPAPAEPSVLSG